MVWFVEMCAEMEARHGERGWKRRLAEMLGVSDSNVQNWIRAGSVPPIVRTAYEAKQEVQDLERELKRFQQDVFVIEELDAARGYRVLRAAPESGRFVDVATTRDLELARAIVQVESGALGEKISAVLSWADDYMEGTPEQLTLEELRDWRQSTRREADAEMANDLVAMLSHE